MEGLRTIAVIDVGKTNAKLVLIDAAGGSVIETRSRANGALTDGPYAHADVEGLWAFILDALSGLNRTHGVGGISITTHGATAALMAGDALALPVLDYEDPGPDETAATYAAARPGFSETYSPRLPGGLNLGAQIFWQSERFARQFATVDAILTYPQYWAWRLTGIKASEVTSLGCHTDLWAPVAGRFSSLVEREGWTALFPPIRPARGALGPIDPGLAARTGLDPATPVACGIHDSNASLLAHLDRREAPFTVVSSGTWTVCMTLGGTTDNLDPARDSLANVDVEGRPVPTARFMGGREFDLLGAPAEHPEDSDIAHALEAPVLIVPGFVPEVGPFPKAKGAWLTDPEGLTPGQRAAAVALYLALVTEAALHLCGIGREIVIEGPFARNTLYGQALAGLTGVPVFASADATGTSLGAGMLLGAGVGDAGAGIAATPLDAAALGRHRAAWLAAMG